MDAYMYVTSLLGRKKRGGDNEEGKKNVMRFFIDTNCRSGAGTTQTHRALVHYKTILSICIYAA